MTQLDIRHHRNQKSISPTRESFDEPGIIGIVPQRFAQSVDRFIQPLLEIDERILRPELIVQFLAGDDLTRLLKKSRKDLERLSA